jgi:GWxTD domain-containing protein
MKLSRLFVAAALFFAIGAEAALSKAAQEWRRGPEKFLMSNEEEKAWKRVASDAAAAEFIDLFWARRDPTPGTVRNEFREEFLTRVRHADSEFGEKRRRGALTDRGQVYILLGPPTIGTRESMGIQGSAAMSSASSRVADSIVWTWPREVAAALGVPKLAASFYQIVGTDSYVRDTESGAISNIVTAAIRKSIVHPELTAVPEWAARPSTEIFAALPVTQIEVKPAGRIGRLVLLQDLGAWNADAAADPLAALQSVRDFAADGELAFVLEYCGFRGPLKVEVKVNDLAAASELEPAPIQAVPGCGAVADMLSLSGLARGSYDLEVTTIEPNGARATAKQRFQIK